MTLRKALFLDRDGTLIVEKNYIKDPALIEFIPEIFPMLRSVQAAGWALVVVSNQAGVARGFMTEDEVRHFNQVMSDQLLAEKIKLDGIYFCPHHPQKGTAPFKMICDCRKPAPGMLLQAARELQLDLSQSWMFGDRHSDIEAGFNAGCQSVLLKTGYGAESALHIAQWQRKPTQVCESLAEALRGILG